MCGSWCWPTCDEETKAGMKVFDYNHMLVIPNGKTCTLDSITYGNFDLFVSKHSKLEIKATLF